MIGPTISGFLAQDVSLATPFLIVAAVAGAVTGLLAARSPAAPTGSRPGPSSGVAVPLRKRLALMRRPAVATAAGGLAVAGAIAATVQLLIPLGLHHDGYSSGDIGLAFSAATLCYLAGSSAVVALRRRTHTRRFAAGAIVLIGLAIIPALAATTSVALIGVLLATSLPRGGLSTVSYALASGAEDPAGRRGVVFGMVNGVWAAAMVLTPLAAGGLQQHVGARAGYAAVMVATLAIGAWLLSGTLPSRSRFAVRSDPAALGE
jgi:MFS family permease